MAATTTEDGPSKTSRAIGHIISALIVVFMLFDAISHIAKPQFVLDANAGMLPEGAVGEVANWRFTNSPIHQFTNSC